MVTAWKLLVTSRTILVALAIASVTISSPATCLFTVMGKQYGEGKRAGDQRPQRPRFHLHHILPWPGQVQDGDFGQGHCIAADSPCVRHCWCSERNWGVPEQRKNPGGLSGVTFMQISNLLFFTDPNKYSNFYLFFFFWGGGGGGGGGECWVGTCMHLCQCVKTFLVLMQFRGKYYRDIFS